MSKASVPRRNQPFQLTGPNGNRSKVVETALIAYIQQQIRRERDQRDQVILERHAKSLNQEAREVLAFQEPI